MLFFLRTTEPNAEMGAVPEIVMPVLDPYRVDRNYGRGAVEDASSLRKPAKDGMLKVVTKRVRQQGA